MNAARAGAIAAAGFLYGCSLMPSAPLPAPFAPLVPASLGRTVQAEQIIRIAHGERSLTLQCTANVTPAETSLNCFTALGQRAFALKHDGQTLSVEPADSEAIAPTRILTDLQLAYWPLAALQASVAGGGWQISEPAPGVRRLRRDGALSAEVHYSEHYSSGTPWNGRVWLVNFEQRYSLDIESRLSGKN